MGVVMRHQLRLNIMEKHAEVYDTWLLLKKRYDVHVVQQSCVNHNVLNEVLRYIDSCIMLRDQRRQHAIGALDTRRFLDNDMYSEGDLGGVRINVE